MANLRSQLDPDEHGANNNPEFKSGTTPYELRCGMCGRLRFVDQRTLNRVQEATKTGLDNPFRCELCEEEYDDLAYEG